MKTINKIKIALAVLLFSVAILSSCQKENNLNPVNTEVEFSSMKTSKSFNCPMTLSMKTPCSFWKGNGEIYETVPIIESILNNCHLESKPNNCKWVNPSITKTKLFQFGSFQDPCLSARAYNIVIKDIYTAAGNYRPYGNQNYIITDYDITSSFSTGGGHKIKANVTYKKIICRAISTRK